MAKFGNVRQLDFVDGNNNFNSPVMLSGNDSTFQNRLSTNSIVTNDIDSAYNNNYASELNLQGISLPSNAKELQSWHAAREVDLMPLVVLNALYMLIGVVGNSTVCYVCAIRMPRTVLNNFVLSLAVAELFGCVLIIPLEITKTMNAYDFDYPVLCKAEKYLRSLVVFFTNCVLIAIATERYQRIVKPHNRHVSMTQFRVTIASSVTFAILAAIPESVLAGSQTIDSSFGKVVVCSTYSSDRYSGTIFPPMWACFVVLVYVISTAAIGSIYCVIAVTIWKRGKLQTDRRSRPNTPDLTLRRRVQYCNSNNHSSIMYLPHHQSLTAAPDPFIRGGSLDRFELGPFLRHNTDCGLLTARASSSDDFEIHAQVHRPVNSIGSPPVEPEEEKEIISPSWFPSFTQTSRFLFEDNQCDEQHQQHHSKDQQQEKQQQQEQQQQQHQQQQLEPNRDSINSGNSSQTKTQSLRISGSVDPESKEIDLRDQSLLSRFSDEENEDLEHNNTTAQLQPQKQHQEHHEQMQEHQSSTLQKKKGRRFTAVFFDELYQTVSRRRRQDAAFFERHESTEDILSPPILTPMGSIRSRSGYSRKRTTFIMFVMTTTTAISLFPHIIVLLYRLAQPTVELRLSPDASVLFHVAWNSFFISLACHPYVYGFWNGRFKKALISLFYGLKEKTKRRRHAPREDDFDFKDGRLRVHSNAY